MKSLTQLLLLTLLALGLAACNTTRGFGEDVEATGDAIQDTAQDAEDALDGDDD